MEACVGAHHLSRKLQLLGHDARLMPAKYVRSFACVRTDAMAPRPA
jgi:transposase